jgi:hypothetical protein
MKITLFAITAILLSAVCAQAQWPEAYLTDNGLNGRYWVAQNTVSKPDFILGYREAVGFTASLAWADDKAKVQRAFDVLAGPGRLTNGEIVKAIDQFYESPLNGPIPITNAFLVMSMQARGKDSPEEIQKEISEMRQASTATPPPALKAKQ